MPKYLTQKQNPGSDLTVAVVMVDSYLDHNYTDLGEHVMFTLQTHVLLLVLLGFIVL